MTPPGNPITDHQQQKKKKKEKKNQSILQAFSKNFSWISLSCIIYITSADHAQTD